MVATERRANPLHVPRVATVPALEGVSVGELGGAVLHLVGIRPAVAAPYRRKELTACGLVRRR